MIYSITVANKDADNFQNSYWKLYPNTPISSSGTKHLFVRTFDVELTEQDYLFLSLKFKFLKMTMKILKPKPINGSNIKFTL